MQLSSNTRRILKNVSWLSVDKAIALLNSIVVGAYVARYLGPAKFGVLAYALALPAMLLPLVSLGLDTLVVRDIVKNPDARGRDLWLLFLARGAAALATICVALSLYATGVIPTSGQEELALVMLGLASLLTSPFGIAAIALKADVLSKYEVWAHNVLVLIGAAVRVLLVRQDQGVIALGATFFALNFVEAFALFIFCRKREIIPRFVNPGWERFRVLLRESWPMIVSGLGVAIYLNIDLVMLRYIAGESDAGIYSVAVRFSTQWYFLPSIVGVSVFPSMIKLHQRDRERYDSFFRDYLRFGALLAYVCILFSLIAFPPLIRILFGEPFAGAIPVLNLHLWAFLFVFLGVARGQHLIAEGWTLYSMVSTIAGVIANVALNLLLIPGMGAIGAALATLISYAIAGVVSTLVIPRLRPIGREQVVAMIWPFPSLKNLKSAWIATRATA